MMKDPCKGCSAEIESLQKGLGLARVHCEALAAQQRVLIDALELVAGGMESAEDAAAMARRVLDARDEGGGCE